MNMYAQSKKPRIQLWQSKNTTWHERQTIFDRYHICALEIFTIPSILQVIVMFPPYHMVAYGRLDSCINNNPTFQKVKSNQIHSN